MNAIWIWDGRKSACNWSSVPVKYFFIKKPKWKYRKRWSTENMANNQQVETFVMFIGYPRSSHSLVGAILDAHPEIIIPHEFNVLQKWKRYNLPKFQRKNLIRYKLYFDLHQTCTEQAMFGKRASRKRTVLGGEFTYLYNVPDLWQGGYKKKIKVRSEDDFHNSWVTITYHSQPKLILKNKEDAPASVAGITR